MADEKGVMFTEDGKPTPLLVARWRGKGALAPLPVSSPLVERDRSAKPLLRTLWKTAFPARSSLPFGPIVESDGRFTGAMLNVWL